MWNDSLDGQHLWSNVNFGEAMADVMTPFTWSVVYQLRLGQWVILPGYPLVGNIGGHPYFNLSIAASVFRIMGKTGQDLLDQIEGTMYTRLPAGMEIPVIPISRGSLLSILPRLAAAQARQRRGVWAAQRYVADNPGWCDQMHTRILDAPAKDHLAHLWTNAIEPHLLKHFWTVLGCAQHQSTYATQLRRELVPLVGPGDADSLLSSVSVERELLASLGPVVGIAQVARGQMDRAQFLRLHGHRGPHEGELSLPRPAEDPAWMERQIELLSTSSVDPKILLERQRQKFEKAWARLQSRYPREAPAIRRRIAEAAARARLREAVRSELARDFWVARAFALRAGNLAAADDDVFFLTIEEVLALLAGDDTALAQIPDRQSAYQRYCQLPPYPPVIVGPFDPFSWAADPHRTQDLFDARRRTSAASPAPTQLRQVNGSPGSAGVATGLVRRLDSPDQGAELLQGEVLVTGHTNIGWTPLFPRAAAVVTDVGAPLSHAAIVARELGIPAVVGCGNATTQLVTGDLVRVDGSRGIVEIIVR